MRKITKKEIVNELNKVLENYGSYHWKILNISTKTSLPYHYYEAIVICKESECIYWVRKDMLDDSILMDLMTVSQNSITQQLN